MFRRTDVDVDIDIDDIQEDGRLEISLVGKQEEGEYWCQAKGRWEQKNVLEIWVFFFHLESAGVKSCLWNFTLKNDERISIVQKTG